MKQELLVPINTFAECLEASERKRISLLKRQLQDKSEAKGFHCNSARFQIRTTILAGVDHKLTERKIQAIKATNPTGDWQKIDKAANISILEKFKEMSFPKAIIDRTLEPITFEQSSIPYNGIIIKVVPSVAFEIEINGKKHIGACMVHLSKENRFTVEQSKMVASLLYIYLGYVAKEDQFVDPSLCICVDPHAGTTINSNNHFAVDMKKVKKLCEELPRNWNDAQEEMAA